ncbi:hypothetical protein [Ferrimonas senticii]|uniref:hypothetical protein n=1 Tax=Ferrimonas senticii TaxID=394566 RepID=UPI0012EC18AE|nr:hypothetical protein [Ferrimonas senticii]
MTLYPTPLAALSATAAALLLCSASYAGPADNAATAAELSYVGSDTCIDCHQGKASFLETGHNFKLNKIENGQAPKYPFTDISDGLQYIKGVDNSAGNPESFADVSYVIGGYIRRAMFLDKDGYIMTGSNVRLNLAKDGQAYGPHSSLDYMAGHAADSHPFSCGSCHTTGWKAYTSEAGDDRNKQRQDNLPGMGGTFAFGGIQCEACHGAGSQHVEDPSKDNITKVAKGRTAADLRSDSMGHGMAITCAECHTKDGERKYPSYDSYFNQAFGGDSHSGRVMEYPLGARFASDALLGMDPDSGEALGAKQDFSCTDCHNPHLSTTNKDEPGHEGAMLGECSECHTDIEFASTADGGGAKGHKMMASCTDCHMPNNIHLFKINLDAPSDDQSHYSKDGKFRQPWLRAADSCQQCHSDYDAKAATIKRIHK